MAAQVAHLFFIAATEKRERVPIRTINKFFSVTLRADIDDRRRALPNDPDMSPACGHRIVAFGFIAGGHQPPFVTDHLRSDLQFCYGDFTHIIQPLENRVDFPIRGLCRTKNGRFSMRML